MTAEEAETIYYEAYAKASASELSGITPLMQAELRRKAWQAVVDAFQKDADIELATKYLAMQGPHCVSEDRINALVERGECEG